MQKASVAPGPQPGSLSRADELIRDATVPLALPVSCRLSPMSLETTSHVSWSLGLPLRSPRRDGCFSPTLHKRTRQVGKKLLRRHISSTTTGERTSGPYLISGWPAGNTVERTKKRVTPFGISLQIPSNSSQFGVSLIGYLTCLQQGAGTQF